MNTRNLLIATVLGISGLAAHLYAPNLAAAQGTSTGAIQGTVVDQKDGSALAGVTVIATSPAMAQTQTAITDEKGTYKINDLPPGDYLVTFYYADITVEHSGIHVGIGKSTPVFQKINQANAGGEVVHITATAPTIDPTSTTQGITIDKNYIKNIPVPGRTFESALGAAAGSQADSQGVSFSGSSSLENQYYVDGVNTTNLTYGTVGSPVINDFIEEIEVITGGYNAEQGRATGGIVNVVTKSGSNEFKGSIFGYWQPGALTAAAKTTPVNASSIDLTPNTVYNADFGFELGGPIIKDKLWFFVGFAPQFSSTDVTRTVKRQTDCRVTANPSAGIPEGSIPGLSACDKMYGDATADVDPRTGFYITDNVDSEIRNASGTNYNMIGKLNYAATPEHQGQLTVEALPSTQTNPGLLGPALSGGGYKQDGLTTDISAKWTSKFNDNKTEVEAVIGYHRDSLNTNALDPSNADYGNSQPGQVLVDGDLNRWGPGFGESDKTNSYQGCKDGAPSTDDPYPLITNCPMSTTEPYYVGGPGQIVRDVEQRRSAKISVTHRVKAAGSHEFKAGIDAEDNLSNKARLYSGNDMTGGGYITNDVNAGQIRIDRYVQLTTMDNTDPRFDNTCRTPNPSGTTGIMGSATLSFKCDYLGGTPGSPGTNVVGNTFNWAAYVRDSWQIQPNLTLNVGLRYEEQRMRYADFLQNTVDPLTGETLGTNAMTLTGNWAPRVGLLYDWTKEGRSKIYVHWGRFYESVPMDINDRSFGGEVFYRQYFTGTDFGAGKPCGSATANHGPAIGGPDGLGCMQNQQAVGQSESLIGASGVLIAPGIQSQYMDEVIGGFEYEILDDLKVGVSYQHRALGRIIEDVSTDGANTYIISNPGQWSSEEETKLENRIAATDDPKDKARLTNQLKLFQGIRIFDPPQRDYNALQFTVTRRFSKKLYVQGSYTFSRTEGNYPGLFQSTNGQVDPNISSQYDLIELLANHNGALPQDRPHYIKLDGYYTFDLKKAGDLTVGIRFRASSGVPENALAGHYLYGPNESYLLPQGSLGRTDFDHGLDVHIGYGRNLNKNMKLEIFADIYNVYNRQGTAAVDDNYAPYYKLSAAGMAGEQQNANPISGGTYDDLIWAKEIDMNGVESAKPIGRNPNFHNPTVRYAPLSARLGVRLTF
jgi:outer membrane receptor protein involved in Fe transport